MTRSETQMVECQRITCSKQSNVHWYLAKPLAAPAGSSARRQGSRRPAVGAWQVKFLLTPCQVSRLLCIGAQCNLLAE
jgi:hypothetical protein